MFLDGMNNDMQRQFQKDCENLSKYFMAGIHKYQQHRAVIDGENVDGQVVTHVVLAGAMFPLAVMIKDLPRRERNKLREFMISKFDEVLTVHGKP